MFGSVLEYYELTGVSLLWTKRALANKAKIRLVVIAVTKTYLYCFITTLRSLLHIDALHQASACLHLILLLGNVCLDSMQTVCRLLHRRHGTLQSTDRVARDQKLGIFIHLTARLSTDGKRAPLTAISLLVAGGPKEAQPTQIAKMQ